MPEVKSPAHDVSRLLDSMHLTLWSVLNLLAIILLIKVIIYYILVHVYYRVLIMGILSCPSMSNKPEKSRKVLGLKIWSSVFYNIRLEKQLHPYNVWF